jgi:hypothetical protein
MHYEYMFGSFQVCKRNSLGDDRIGVGRQESLVSLTAPNRMRRSAQSALLADEDFA